MGYHGWPAVAMRSSAPGISIGPQKMAGAPRDGMPPNFTFVIPRNWEPSQGLRRALSGTFREPAAEANLAGSSRQIRLGSSVVGRPAWAVVHRSAAHRDTMAHCPAAPRRPADRSSPAAEAEARRPERPGSRTPVAARRTPDDSTDKGKHTGRDRPGADTSGQVAGRCRYRAEFLRPGPQSMKNPPSRRARSETTRFASSWQSLQVPNHRFPWQNRAGSPPPNSPAICGNRSFGPPARTVRFFGG
jgi:hypothetical protein